MSGSSAREETQELAECFKEWAADHGPIWWPVEARLAEAIAAVTGIRIDWSLDAAASSGGTGETEPNE